MDLILDLPVANCSQLFDLLVLKMVKLRNVNITYSYIPQEE